MKPTVWSRTLGDLVAEVPARAAVLDRLGLDYCCHGQRSLHDACSAAGLEVEVVGAELGAELDVTQSGSGADTHLTGDALAMVDEIVATHHRYLRDELPELERLAEKVEGVHAERHPELARVSQLVRALRADLEPHLDKEELVLFPAARRLAGGGREFPFGTIGNPIRMMGFEHERAGDLLAALREVSGGYVTPADGCASYQALYARLANLEADTHLHIHKENNVLFPMLMEMEAAPVG